MIDQLLLGFSDEMEKLSSKLKDKKITEGKARIRKKIERGLNPSGKLKLTWNPKSRWM